MTESAEPSGRFDYLEDNDSRVPSEDDEEKKKPSVKKGKGIGFPKMPKLWGRRSDSEEKKALSELQRMGLRRYDYMVLHRATGGFSSTCRIALSNVYKGMLEGNQAVAIKVVPWMPSSLSRSHCLTEIKVLSKMRHRNVVELLGWCLEAGRMALVFEFMPNGSLDRHLLANPSLPSLPWEIRYKSIAVGLATALLYLQEALERCVVHGDIKPSNILLDSDFNPRLADFGLVKVASHLGVELDFPSTVVVGTLGYLDPECMTGKFSEASDIYAFGVVALQLVSGRMPINHGDGKIEHLPEWVRRLHEKGRIQEAVDPNLGDEFNGEEAERLLLVGLWCTRWDAKSRPPIQWILQFLKFDEPSYPNSISRVGMEQYWIHSSPERTQEEPNLFRPGVDSDSTTTSMNTTDRDHTLKDIIEDDGISSESVLDDYEEDEPALAFSPDNTTFEIGIPPECCLSEAGNNRKDGHCNILKGFVDSLHEMMRSEENLPRFDDALKKIRICTAALVVTVGLPLDDWDALVQLVLRYLKQRDDFFKFCGDDVPLADTVTTLSSLDEGMRVCSRTIKENRGRLKDSEERQARAQQRCSSLEAELAQARGVLSSIKDEIKAAEERIAESLSSLQKRRRHHAILKQHDHVLSQISSFTC